jgi:uncharacterized protein YkwD
MSTRARLVLIAVSAVLGCIPSHTQTAATHSERRLFNLVNQERQAQAVPSLKWNDALATAARQHAEVMAQHGEAQHVFPGEANMSARAREAGARFTWLSENVIQGTSAEQAHGAFMKSPSHRANILDRDMDSVGVGVVEKDGQVFVVEDFSKAR